MYLLFPGGRFREKYWWKCWIRFAPDRILIEPSGVGKLSDVMTSVIDLEKDHDVKLNGLVTVVNALKASKQMKAFGEFFNNQIEYATTVVLSRTQKAKPEQLEFCGEADSGAESEGCGYHNTLGSDSRSADPEGHGGTGQSGDEDSG